MPTMQTNPLLNQPGVAAVNGTNARSNASNGDGGQFGAMLSNEMELRQQVMPTLAPSMAPAAAPQPNKPQAADKPAQPDNDAPAPQQAAKPASNQADKAEAADGKDDGAEDEDGADASAQASDPANAMLALMASLQQPAADTKAAGNGGAAAQAFDALAGAGKGKRGDAAQLAALQAAMKSVAKDGAGATAGVAGKAFADLGALSNPALAASGAALGADDKRAAASDAGADLRALFAPGKAQAQPELQLDAAELTLQQAREAASAQQPVAAALAATQPAFMEAAQAVAVASEHLSARVGTQAWDNQVGQKIVYMAGGDEQSATLTLNPPDLGPLQVVLSVSNDQADVSFSANQLEVRQALENALPRLREMLSESGIALGNASVNAGMPDQRQAQDQGAQARRGGGANRSGRIGGDDGVADAASRPQTRTAIIGDRGMVDTFA